MLVERGLAQHGDKINSRQDAHPAGSPAAALLHNISMGIFSFLKRKGKADTATNQDAEATTATELPAEAAIESVESLDKKLEKTRGRFTSGLLGFLTGRSKIDDELLEDLESQLIMSDISVPTAANIIDKVSKVARRDSNADLSSVLRSELIDLLKPVELPLEIPDSDKPFVLLVVGVNGAGKTTTIGKIARQLQNGGKSVMLAAGDTFRAAAVEQLQTWGERNNIPVISQGSGADSASVIFDALQAASARGIDVLIADTAGRLHTQSGLMDELSKVARVLGKLDSDAPHETLLVLDGTTGQNGLSQAREFGGAVDITGLAITKLDGTAKGGMVFTLANELRLPIRFIGVGEGIYDLRVFLAEDYVEALLVENVDSQ